MSSSPNAVPCLQDEDIPSRLLEGHRGEETRRSGSDHDGVA